MPARSRRNSRAAPLKPAASVTRSSAILDRVLIPLAHAGHWAVYVLYAVPVLIVLGSILLTALRTRPDDEGGEDPDPAA